MKKERNLMDAITNVPDKMINETGEARAASEKLHSRRNRFRPLTAAACALLLLGGGIFAAYRTGLFGSGSRRPAPPLLAAAAPLLEVTLPQSYSFDDYEARSKVREENPLAEEFLAGLSEFSYETASEFLKQGKENINYSPVSLYLALSMAASGAASGTGEELLTLLRAEDTDVLAAQCGSLFRRLYTDNEIGVLKLSNSLWMDDSVSWKQEYIQNAAENFYAPAFCVDFASGNTGKAIASWIAEQTGGTLAPDFPTDPNQILSLINTVYFHDEWIDEFSESDTKPDSFYPADGSPVTCDFMHRTYNSHGFSVGDGYTRSSLGLKNSSMIFVLPDEGVSVQDLLASPEKLREALEGGESFNGEVNWQIPKFDFSSNLSLADGLKRLGVSSAFSGDADFSGITDGPAFFSGVTQGTHIAVNEQGVDASAFTAIEYAGAARPEGRADMILNRPFLYGITFQGVLLFVGVCENPAAN